MSPTPVAVPTEAVRKQGAWSLWWLTMITFSVYYLVWYARINRELYAVLGTPRQPNGAWWSQLVPFYGLYALHQTAKRVNAAHASVGSPTRVSPFVTWFWAPSWFASQTRYLQRRINVLHDVLASRASQHAPVHVGEGTAPALPLPAAEPDAV